MSTIVRIVSSPVFVGVAGVLIVLKLYMRITTGVCKSNARLDGKTVIITGSNTGIGYETAKDVAKRGAKIIMVCRDMDKAQRARDSIVKESGNSDIKLKHIDFSSLSSVRECANELLKDESKIHVLLNNAGTVSGAFTNTDDGLDALMQTNCFGPFLFTNMLLGVIKSSSPSRILNVSSETHRMANLDLKCLNLSNISSSTTAYANSKLCNIIMANELSRKLEGTDVTVNSLTPGVVLTEILRDAPTWFRISWNGITKIFLKNAKEGAQTSVYACVSPELAGVTGKYFMDCKLKEVSKEANDLGSAKKLWELSEKAVQLKPHEKHY